MQMQRNPVKKKLANGEPSIGTWVSGGSPALVEILAQTELEWLTMDMEHTAIDYSALQGCLLAMRGTPTVPFVRVAWNDPALIKRALDIGSLGVVVPTVETVEEAENAVKASRYAPVGERGIGSARGVLVWGADYYQRANDEIAVVCMVESAKGVENIDRILEVPGIDIIFIGPNDLASSLGVPLGLDNKHPDHVQAVEQVLAATKKAGVPAGIHCGSGEEVGRRINQGFQWLPISSETRVMTAGFSRELAIARETTAGGAVEEAEGQKVTTY